MFDNNVCEFVKNTIVRVRVSVCPEQVCLCVMDTTNINPSFSSETVELLGPACLPSCFRAPFDPSFYPLISDTPVAPKRRRNPTNEGFLSFFLFFFFFFMSLEGLK